MLDDVGDAQLREYVVGRVVVARPVPSAGCSQPTNSPVPDGAGGASAGSATQPRTTGSAGSSAPGIASGVTTQKPSRPSCSRPDT